MVASGLCGSEPKVASCHGHRCYNLITGIHSSMSVIRKQKFTSTSTERQKRSQKLAPVLVIISGNSLVFSRKIITSAGFYRCCAAGASAPAVVTNQSPSHRRGFSNLSTGSRRVFYAITIDVTVTLHRPRRGQGGQLYQLGNGSKKSSSLYLLRARLDSQRMLQ